MNTKPTVVFDTKILLRATINRKSLPARLFFDERNAYHLAVSTEIIAEARDVLNRQELRSKFRTLTDDSVAHTLTRLIGSQHVTLTSVKAVSRDPKDDIFLATAINANAQYLVTEDNDLLVLDPYQSVRIVDALAFLKILQALQLSENAS